MKAMPKAIAKRNPGRASKRSRPLENRHFLLVEDGTDRPRLWAQLLEDAGAEVTLERHALTGVIVAVAMPERFDALILDVNLPHVEIFEAGVALRGAGFDRPIIALVPPMNGKAKVALDDVGCNVIPTTSKINDTFVGMVAEFIQVANAALN